MEFKKRSIQKKHSEKLKNKTENTGKSFFSFGLLALCVFVILQNDFVKHSLFLFNKDEKYIYYSGEESGKIAILETTALIDKELKENNQHYLQLSLKYRDEISRIEIETSLKKDSKSTSQNIEQFVQIIQNIKKNNVLLKNKEIDVVIKSKRKDEIFHNIIN